MRKMIVAAASRWPVSSPRRRGRTAGTTGRRPCPARADAAAALAGTPWGRGKLGDRSVTPVEAFAAASSAGCDRLDCAGSLARAGRWAAPGERRVRVHRAGLLLRAACCARMTSTGAVGHVAVRAEDQRHDVLVRRLRRPHHVPLVERRARRDVLRSELDVSGIISGGIGYSWFVVRSSAGWTCPTVIPWVSAAPEPLPRRLAQRVGHAAIVGPARPTDGLHQEASGSHRGDRAARRVSVLSFVLPYVGATARITAGAAAVATRRTRSSSSISAAVAGRGFAWLPARPAAASASSGRSASGTPSSRSRVDAAERGELARRRAPTAARKRATASGAHCSFQRSAGGRQMPFSVPCGRP